MSQNSFVPPKRYEQEDGGCWTLGAKGRVILKSGGAPWEELAACVERLGEEISIFAFAPQLRDVEPLAGDLVIQVAQAEELAETESFGEGYVIRIGDAAQLIAQSVRGAFYGLRRIAELLEDGGLCRGTIVDWPDTAERGLHLDIGRKYYSQEWIAACIQDMSRMRMNTLWLHFSENEGFRIACDSHPEVPSLAHLTKAQVKELIRLANAHHIDVCPSLDCPGHLGQALQEHPRWQLPRKDGSRLHTALNITDPDAKQFMLDLLDEYMDLFAGSKMFHMGGDEFIDFRDLSPYPVMDAWAKEHLGPEYTGIDTYIQYLNEVAAHIRARGFQVRVWNDGLYRSDVEQRLELDRDVQIAYWTSWDHGMASLQTFLDRGYQVVNYHADLLYYILLIRNDYTDPSPEKILAEWDPSRFPNNLPGNAIHGPQTVPPEQSDRLLGGCFSIWSDWPDLQDEDEVKQRSWGALNAMALRCWTWKQDH